MLPQKLAFVDIETTGLGSDHDHIMEIGILRIEDGKLVKSYQTLINPKTSISPFISDMTGITKQSLKNAPTFDEVKDEILEMLDDCVFVAHNVRFDYGFVKKELLRNGIRFSAKHLCTVKLSRYLFPLEKKHNLDSVMQRFSIDCERRHRAFDDAAVLWEFYQKAQVKFEQEIFLTAVDRALLRPALPVQLAPEVFEKLPEAPGVYIFYSIDNSVLYVGKSINIKERVLSHFTNDTTSIKEMKISQQLARIEIIPTAGELGALIKEATMIKQLQPLYNRRLRIKHQLVVLKIVKDSDGYDTIFMGTVNAISLQELPQIVGMYISKRQAKEFLTSLIKPYALCEKLLGLEKTTGGCFSHKLGICKGACVKKENPMMYNIRVMMAFYMDKIKPWPYDGPIIFKEVDEYKENEEAFVIDKWCLLGSISSSDLGNLPQVLSREYCFDVDTYKILKQFLTKKKFQSQIKVISKKDLRMIFPREGIKDN